MIINENPHNFFTPSFDIITENDFKNAQKVALVKFEKNRVGLGTVVGIFTDWKYQYFPIPFPESYPNFQVYFISTFFAVIF